MKRKVSEEDSEVVFIGEEEDEREIREIDVQLETKAIASIRLSVLDHKEEAGDVLWKIKVEEISEAQPHKPVVYEIKRKFSEIKWLVEVLREIGKTFILPIVGIGSSSLSTYYKTKIVKDTKTFECRHDHLNRFLKKLSERKQVINEKVFQIFICPERDEFEMFKTLFTQEHKPTSAPLTQWFKSVFDTIVNALPKFSTDSEMITVYKEMFGSVERDVEVCHGAMSDILTSHSEYLAYLKEYNPELTAADQEYSQSIEKLVKMLDLITQEIGDNKNEVGRERTKEGHDRFKANFPGEIERYRKEIDSELKELAHEFSRINEVGCTNISKLFREKFTIQV